MSGAGADSDTIGDLTLALATRLINEVASAAASGNDEVAAAVVDAGGHLVAALRMDNTPFGAAGAAIDKARTAVAWNAPTDAWAEVSKPGANGWGITSLLDGRMIVLPGGVPLRIAHGLIGALGVSGALPEHDRLYAIQALRNSGLTDTF